MSPNLKLMCDSAQANEEGYTLSSTTPMCLGSEQVKTILEGLVSPQRNIRLPTRCRPDHLDFVFVAGSAVMATFDGGAITWARLRVGQRAVLQPTAGADPIEVAVEIQLEPISRRRAGPACCSGPPTASRVGPSWPATVFTRCERRRQTHNSPASVLGRAVRSTDSWGLRRLA